MTDNIDNKVVADFGAEWSTFDQTSVSAEEQLIQFQRYFSFFPWHLLSQNSIAFDVGCGSGRWAKYVAPRVGLLHCIDPSAVALNVTRKTLAEFANCEFYCASVDNIPLQPNSMDFGYSLGVLHHVPDTQKGINDSVALLKPGGIFLIYLYYALDGRPKWFIFLWCVTDFFRGKIAKLPSRIKRFVTDVIAIFIYWPISRFLFVLEKLGLNVACFPLSSYRESSFYTLRTDALDRFGTSLEKRFTRKQIGEMMEEAGLKDIVFSENEPFWCAYGIKSAVKG